ncbi:MAG: 30S ribosomal protein S4 [DPANN group archaeon]|nr:30S ribosomal protein S4 [DPANN group archaeon]
MRRQIKKYEGPRHPWKADRIKDENKLISEYGLVNKREIYKAQSKLRTWREQAKQTVGLIGAKKETAEKILLEKLQRLGLLGEESDVDDILSLTVRDVLEKRLQTILYKKGFAVTPKQARQFIVHRKVIVNSEKVDSPSYFVRPVDEITFVSGFNPKAQAEQAIREQKAEEAQKK